MAPTGMKMYTSQDARANMPSVLDLNSYSGEDMLADLGSHRIKNLPLKGRVVKQTGSFPHSAGKDSIGDEVRSKWASLFDPNLAEELETDDLGLGGSYRNGPNYNPRLGRAQTGSRPFNHSYRRGSSPPKGSRAIRASSPTNRAPRSLLGPPPPAEKSLLGPRPEFILPIRRVGRTMVTRHLKQNPVAGFPAPGTSAWHSGTLLAPQKSVYGSCTTVDNTPVPASVPSSLPSQWTPSLPSPPPLVSKISAAELRTQSQLPGPDLAPPSPVTAISEIQGHQSTSRNVMPPRNPISRVSQPSVGINSGLKPQAPPPVASSYSVATSVGPVPSRSQSSIGSYLAPAPARSRSPHRPPSAAASNASTMASSVFSRPTSTPISIRRSEYIRPMPVSATNPWALSPNAVKGISGDIKLSLQTAPQLSMSSTILTRPQSVNVHITPKTSDIPLEDPRKVVLDALCPGCSTHQDDETAGVSTDISGQVNGDHGHETFQQTKPTGTDQRTSIENNMGSMKSFTSPTSIVQPILSEEQDNITHDGLAEQLNEVLHDKAARRNTGVQMTETAIVLIQHQESSTEAEPSLQAPIIMQTRTAISLVPVVPILPDPDSMASSVAVAASSESGSGVVPTPAPSQHAKKPLTAVATLSDSKYATTEPLLSTSKFRRIPTGSSLDDSKYASPDSLPFAFPSKPAAAKPKLEQSKYAPPASSLSSSKYIPQAASSLSESKYAPASSSLNASKYAFSKAIAPTFSGGTKAASVSTIKTASPSTPNNDLMASKYATQEPLLPTKAFREMLQAKYKSATTRQVDAIARRFGTMCLGEIEGTRRL